MKVLVTLFAALGLIASAAAGAADQPAAKPPVEARIAFANHGGIYNWQVENDHTILIESRDHRWYRGTLLAPCFDLPFTETLGFESNADGSFDKFGAIKVRGQRCPLVSLVETTPPAKKGKKLQSPPKITPRATTN